MRVLTLARGSDRSSFLQRLHAVTSTGMGALASGSKVGRYAHAFVEPLPLGRTRSPYSKAYQLDSFDPLAGGCWSRKGRSSVGLGMAF
jgi:hypothetical protein